MKNKLSINLEVSLVEIIMSIFIFAIAGVIMLNCFAIARFTQIKANDKVIASNIIQSDMELIRDTKNSIEIDEFLLNTYTTSQDNENGHMYVKYYDHTWQTCDDDEKEYKISINILNVPVNSGEMKAINMVAEKIKPYPFVNNETNKSNSIFSIESKKFFPLNLGGS